MKAPSSKEPVSSLIKKRLIAAGASYKSNDNIADYILHADEKKALLGEVTAKVQALLESLVIDTEGDPNAKRTAERMAKMYLQEVFHGRYHPCPEVTDYPNDKALQELYLIGPMDVRSSCSHHMVPVIGKAWVGVLPGERILGLSKFSRLVQWIMNRPQMQEEATMMLGELLQKRLRARGIAITLEAKHFCMHWRGVKEQSTTMTTSFFSGSLKTNEALQQQFLHYVYQKK